MREVSRIKINTQQVLLAKSVSRGEKSMYKIHEERNQHATSFMNKINTQQAPRTKISMQQVQ